MQEGKEYVTKGKLEQLEEELKELKTVKRKEVAEQLEYARSLGDLSENAEYQEAREGQARVEARIRQIEDMLKRVEILPEGKHSTDVVDVGSVVTIEKTKNKEQTTYEIVGPEEADVTENKVSYQSPLGSALIEKKKGDQFDFETPKGKVKYKVIKIS